ncbi:hypothetical protein [Paenibacillus sp. NPDC058071]|uniref:hypothetical protein n=1 Tax=Paenibacillus sp. NPDC058071 TaxID=3346326 RepID=UPI0036DF05AA
MPIIPNFPQALLREHQIWHHDHHVTPGTTPPVGFGEQFLRFHRDFINRVYVWYERQGYDPRYIAPWDGIPEAIRRSPCHNEAAANRIINNPRSFPTLDQYGRFMEGSGVHGCIHAASARIFREPEIDNFDLAPRQTVFYNIHGMIDGWYRNWEAAWGLRPSARQSGKR